MGEAKSLSQTVGEKGAARDIAILKREGGAPGLFWLGGYRSDMTGTKAAALDAHAAARGLACTRFDYSGHGASSGRFEDMTVSDWLADAIAVFAAHTAGPQIVIGSSMGGWIALLLAEAMKASGRVAGLVLIAPATDMTGALMWPQFDAAARDEITRTGILRVPSDHDEPMPITLKLIEDGRRHHFGERLIETGCPVHILQGAADEDVPWQHALDLVSHLASDDVVFTMVKDGDHRLSRPEDLERLTAAVDGLIAGLEPA